MLETVAIPILIKAVDFLFGEGSKILQERRERRKGDIEAEISKNKSSTIKPSTGVQSADAITSIETALKLKVTESMWQKLEVEVEHLVSLLEIHTRNYHLAKEQRAKWGDALVPAIIINNLTEAEDAVAETMNDLQVTLSKVYGKVVATPEAN